MEIDTLQVISNKITNAQEHLDIPQRGACL